jgi:hypothetical protein
MASVTQRIKEIKQPHGGYINPSQFIQIPRTDGKELFPKENIPPFITGLAVDYLTRLMMTGDPYKAFEISIRGYSRYALELCLNSKDFRKRKDESDEDAIIGYALKKDPENSALTLIMNINEKELTDNTIISACKLTAYDVWMRNPDAAFSAIPSSSINPDEYTIKNIRIMVERSLSFWKDFGEITAEGFTFKGTYMENGRKITGNGYTSTVDTGDGDYLTEDTLWDFKVSKYPPTKDNTLQLLMYYIMGKKSNLPVYRSIKNIGIFNPRLNMVYTLPASEIPKETFLAVEKDVIGYR